MTQEKKTVALIYGGIGREHSVSVRGAEYVRGVVDPEKYALLPIYIAEDGEWLLTTDEGTREVYPARKDGRHGLSLDGEIIPVDCAIPLLHGDFGEDGRVQGALDVAGIPFVGADTVAGAVCIDKSYTRLIANSLGIPVARGRTVARGASADEALSAACEIGFPVFVKPTRLGSSIGASVARDEKSFASAYRQASSHGCSVLVEELIGSKRELEVGLLVTRDGTVVSPPAEVLCADFYSFDKKYRSGTRTVCPVTVEPWVDDSLREWVPSLARALDLRGTARMDFFLSDDRLLFNEINTMPGFTGDSLYPRLMDAAGIPPRLLFDLLIADVTGEG